jgi:hypothetical protein
MAIDYNTLFNRLGKYVKVINNFITLQKDELMGSAEGADDILDQFNDRRDLVTGLLPQFQGWQQAVIGWCNSLKAQVDILLADLQQELNCPSASPDIIIDYLIEDMVTNAEDVLENTISTTAVAPLGTNVGDGTLYASETNVDGVDDERIYDEIVAFRCITDRHTGAAAGSELFQVVGFPTPQLFEVDPNDASAFPLRGGGVGSSMTTVDSTSFLPNGSFDAFTADAPTSWTLVAGVASTNYFEETTLKLFGDAALKITATASPTDLEISQNIVSLIDPETIYVAAIRLRGSVGVGPGLSTFSVTIEGTGAPTISVYPVQDPSSLSISAYTEFLVFFVTPKDIPTDYRIRIRWITASAEDPADLYVDEMVLATPYEFGFVRYALTRGLTTEWLKDDEIVSVPGSDYAGVFQTFFGYVYGKQLPSDPTPSQADSKAT